MVGAIGCGTTRWTDSKRTATEQLLISDAIDNTVQAIDVKVLAGEKVYFDEKRLNTVVDKDYLVGSLRQHLLASGCLLTEKREDALYVVEARAGAVGTDHHDVLYGIPATNVPSLVNLPGVPSSIPEIPFAKRTAQTAVAKLALFAYHRETGRAVWQSGLSTEKSRVKDYWVLGAGPLQRGTIYDGTLFAGQKISNPFRPLAKDKPGDDRLVDLTAEAVFSRPEQFIAALPREQSAPPVANEAPAPQAAPAVAPNRYVSPVIMLPQPPPATARIPQPVPFQPPVLPVY